MNPKIVVSKISTFDASTTTFGEIAALYNEAQRLSNDGFEVSFTHGDEIVIKALKTYDPTGMNWLEVSHMYLSISKYENQGFTAKYE